MKGTKHLIFLLAVLAFLWIAHRGKLVLLEARGGPAAQGQPNLVPGTPGEEPARIQPVAPNVPPDFQPDKPEKSPFGKPTMDPVKARKEAQDLATLANEIPSEVQQVTNHVLPKDLALKLKRIEKLAKNLRGEISLPPGR